jgi:DNA invertase Pin-like site-specific DNA recombinase
MLIGYARVSTEDQHLYMHVDALKSAGCEETFTDVASGVKSQQPGLEKAIAFLREGDTLVVWKLDRFGRSLQHLTQAIKDLHEKKIFFKSLQENIDTTTSGGRPPMLNKRQIGELKQHYKNGNITVSEICKIFQVSRPTFYNYLKTNDE